MRLLAAPTSDLVRGSDAGKSDGCAGGAGLGLGEGDAVS